jgi:multidrug transporter EmrE-like cation transporter
MENMELAHPGLYWLFLANATVLITHQIDAAYWHEWDLFFIPGGNQVNLLLNLPIIAFVLYAHGRIVPNVHKGLAFYKLLAGLGFLTVAIHSFFLLRGSESFNQPMSLALLVATFVLSAWQLMALRAAPVKS